MTVELGKTYKDVVTGFTGVAVSRHEYLQGCARIALEHLDKDGKPENFAFDEPNLVPVGNKKNVLDGLAKPARTGGPHDHRSTVDRH